LFRLLVQPYEKKRFFSFLDRGVSSASGRRNAGSQGGRTQRRCDSRNASAGRFALMMLHRSIFPRKRRSAPRDPRVKIFAWAFFISLICGAIEFGQPLEDVIQSVRDEIRQRPASKDIVVVEIDDRSAAELGMIATPRRVDAQVLDKLFAMGAKRVFFDRVYADKTTTADDAIFAKSLGKHEGHVFLGAMRSKDERTGEYFEVWPRPEFKEVARVTSLNGKTSPFSLTAKLAFQTPMDGKPVPSMSAVLAGRYGPTGEFYRPDWSIRIDSIPTVTFLNLLNNRVSFGEIRNKDVIIGLTQSSGNDLHRILFQGWRNGVHFHVVGAETLKKGTPQNWGWMPAFFVSLILSIVHLLARTRILVVGTIAVTFLTLAGAPLFLDAKLISAEVVPAGLFFIIVAYRSMNLRRVMKSSRTNVASGLPNLVALREVAEKQQDILISLKIRNYAEIIASFDQSVETAIVEEARRRIMVSDAADTIYHSEDSLLWFTTMSMGEELAHHLEGLKAVLGATHLINGRSVDVSVAFGVDGDIDRTIASRIGSAMLCAEEAARGNDIWKFYDPQRQHEAAWQLSLLSRLDQAIDDGEVWVAYQSKLNLKTGEIDGAEALVRWDHPERGRIDPEEFIVVAEKHNRIEKLTVFVLDQAISSAARIMKRDVKFNIAVNLSVLLLEKAHLLDLVDGVLKKYAVPPGCLTLEITETGRLDRHGPSIAMMERLAAHGIHVSIDDYGTGNATLDYLKILPSDEVKIDRQFIANVETNDKDRILVKSTIDMVHSLGRKVVAEGVESQSVLDALKALGCDTAQGYLIGLPMPYSDFVDSLFTPAASPKLRKQM
jgi:diguanylate cyclase